MHRSDRKMENRRVTMNNKTNLLEKEDYNPQKIRNFPNLSNLKNQIKIVKYGVFIS